MAFILKHQRALYCGVKRYLLTKRVNRRSFLIMQCQKIQRCYSNYRNFKLLSTVADIMRKKRKRIIVINNCAHILSAFFRMLFHRKKYLKTRNACIMIQTFARNIIAKRKKIELQKECIYCHETQIITVVAAFMETVRKSEEDQEVTFITNVDEDIVIKWETIVSKYFQQKQEKQLNASAHLIQLQWRLRTHKVKLERQKLMKQKCKIWLMSFAREQRNTRMMTVWAAFVIQKHYKNTLQWRMRVQQIVVDEQKKRELVIAYKTITNFIRFRVRMTRAKIRLHILKQQRIKQLDSCLKIQCWWRQRLCIAKLHHKQYILQKWVVLVEMKCSSTVQKAAKIIQSRIRLRRRQKDRSRAAVVLASQITILLRERKRRNMVLLEKHNAAATLLGCQIRGMLVRTMIHNQKTAAVCIQRFWRMISCRQFYRRLCIQEQKKKRLLEVKEKEFLKEQQRLQLISLLFEKTDNSAAKIIQTRYRHYISVIHREIEAKEKEEEERRKSEVEEERRRAYNMFKKRNKYIRSAAAAKQYMSNVLSVVSNFNAKEVINEVKQTMKNHKKSKTEKENLYKELVIYSNSRSHGIVEKSAPVKSFNESITSALGCYNWFDKRCEQFMLSYVLFPEELLQLRR